MKRYAALLLCLLFAAPLGFGQVQRDIDKAHDQDSEQRKMEKPSAPCAEQCCPEMKGMPGMMMQKQMKIMRMDMDLKLTDEQQKQVDDIEFKSALETAKLRADLDVARINFDYEMRKDLPDEGKVKAMLVKIGDLETNLKIAEITKKLKIGKILTPEQRKMMMKAHQCPCGRPMP